HGDLYLNNIIAWKNQPMVFDCLEFNESFRWTDTMADVGFLAMDLEDNYRSDYAYRFINQYMETSGDYNGLVVLRFYQSYRAVVRAKIALFSHDIEKYTRYMDVAEQYTTVAKPALIIMHGVSGSGKSTRAKQLVEKLGAVQIRSDVERKRLVGLSSSSKTNSPVNQGIYTEAFNQKTYQRLLELADIILRSGYSVIVDAAFLNKQHRDGFAQLAKRQQVPFKISPCYLQEDELKKRLLSRVNDPSEACSHVVSMQLETIEELNDEERRTLLND
ncbi:MAG: AAA family ATPase, partial [Gammaproteobacteria bacterium]